MKKNKQFTQEDLDRAIDLALSNSQGERNRVEGMRDVTRTLLKVIDSTYKLRSDEERLHFIEHAIRGLLAGYEQKLYAIDNISVWEEFESKHIDA